MSKRNSSTLSSSTKRQKGITAFFSRPNSSSTSSSTSSSSNIETKTSKSSSPKQYDIFLDLDGVLVDFQAGLRKLFPKQFQTNPNPDIPVKLMWGAIGRTTNFYRDLPWTSDGIQLWNALKSHPPEILTGVPMNQSARIQKYQWCLREFQKVEGSDHNIPIQVNHVDMAGGKRSHTLMNHGVRMKKQSGVINVITCWSKNKHYESGPNRVLIDDRAELGIAWKEKGGIFVHHTDTISTLQKLQELGIIAQPDKDHTSDSSLDMSNSAKKSKKSK